MSVIKCNIPLNVQYEITYNCNNRCVFCYNKKQNLPYTEMNTQEAIRVIENVASCGVMSLNFNGGEPLTRDDFFDIVSVASDRGLDIHMNTNASLVDDLNAKMISKFFPAICTTVLDSNDINHDGLSGRNGALRDAICGIRNLQKHDVYVAVNIMLSRRNIDNIKETYSFLHSLGIKSVLITRYVPCENYELGLDISDTQFLQVIDIIREYNYVHGCFDRIAFPQPYKLCNTTGALRTFIKDCNIPCNIGLCTASISPNGDFTPCNLVKKPVLGNLLTESLEELWSRFEGEEYFCNQHLEKECVTCSDLQNCGGGCKGYNDVVKKGR